MLRQGELNPAWATEHLDKKNQTVKTELRMCVCGLPRTLEVLVSMPSKQEYEEHGEREEKEKGKEAEGKVEEEEEEDHLHHFFTSLFL